MRKAVRGIVFFLLLFPPYTLVSGQHLTHTECEADRITDSMQINANAVVRDDRVEFSYLAPDHTRLKVHKLITILNKNGDNRATFLQLYDKFHDLTDFRGTIYDRNGNPIKKIRMSDLADIPNAAGYDQFNDIRYKGYRPLLSVYPFTVEYDYQVDMPCSFFFPSWTVFDGYNVSVEKSELTVILPQDFRMNYRQFRVGDQPLIRKIDKSTEYTWQVRHFQALNREPFSDDIRNYVPFVYAAPSDFYMDGYSGNMTTWDNYANWIRQLNEGRDLLTDSRSAEIQQMVKGISGDREKVKVLYHYLQQRTRYFNITLGIGGLQTMDAKKVDEVGYGDCKGLTTYMKALLKAAGIRSYWALVNSGNDYPKLMEDFPSHQFDHVILCVPLQNDTVWLECTNQEIPFGFLGDFTSDRKVLLIKESGGELVRTPVYMAAVNTQDTRAKVSVLPDGNATAEISRTFGNIQFEDEMAKLHAGVHDQEQWLYAYIGLPSFKIHSFNFLQPDPAYPSSVLHVSLDIHALGSCSGKRIFMPVNLVNRSTFIPDKVMERRTNFRRLYAYTDLDSVEYLIPAGLTIEFLPEDVFLSTPFGTYVSKTVKEANKIIYYRKVEIFKGDFSGTVYDDLIKFYHDIMVADQRQAVLIAKE